MNRVGILHTFLLLLIISQYSYAQTNDSFKAHPIMTDKFEISFGIFFPEETFKLKINGDTPGDEIDFNSQFDHKNAFATYFFNFGWHFAKRWKLSAEYFGLDSSYMDELKKDIKFNELVFKKGSFVEIGTGWKLARLYLSYSAVKNLKHELGFGLGAHLVQVDAYIEGEVLTNIGDVEFDKSSVKATVPLPNVGIWYLYAPSNRWLLSMRADWFALSVSDYGGSLWNLAPGVNYQVLKNLGLGLSYRYFDISAKVDQSDWNGQFNLIHKGPLLSVTVNF